MPVRPRSVVSEVNRAWLGVVNGHMRGYGGTATCGCNTGAMAGLLGALLVGKGHFRWIFSISGGFGRGCIYPIPCAGRLLAASTAYGRCKENQ